MNDKPFLAAPLGELERRLRDLRDDARRAVERHRLLIAECRRVNAASRAARAEWQACLEGIRTLRDRTKRAAERAAARR
jgi:hypothetical protein